MKATRPPIYLLTMLLASPFIGTPARAATITIQVITTFDYPGSTHTYPSAINDHNEITGFFESPNRAITSGFTRTVDGQFSAPIVDPGDTHNLTAALGINNSETVLGYFFGVDDYHGFFFSGGVYTQYDVPGSSGTVLQGINNAGDFVGYYYTPINELKGFMNIGGTVTTIDIPGGSNVTPHQLNSANQVVGYYVDNASGFGYSFYTGLTGTLQYPISAPGSTTTYLYGINDRGWMVGKYYDHSRIGHGLLFIPPSQFVTFDYANSPVVTLTGINRKGFICGYYADDSGVHGILARVRRTGGNSASE